MWYILGPRLVFFDTWTVSTLILHHQLLPFSILSGRLVLVLNHFGFLALSPEPFARPPRPAPTAWYQPGRSEIFRPIRPENHSQGERESWFFKVSSSVPSASRLGTKKDLLFFFFSLESVPNQRISLYPRCQKWNKKNIFFFQSEPFSKISYPP